MDKIEFIRKYLPKIFYVVFGIIGILLIRFILSIAYHNPYNKVNQIVDKINEEKLSYVDNNTMFIRAERHKKVIEMTYTVDAEPWITTDQLKDKLKKSENFLRDYFIIKLKIEPYIDQLRELNVTFEHNYYDKSYNSLLKIVIKPEDYK